MSEQHSQEEPGLSRNGDFSELKFSRAQSFFDKSLTIRLLVVILFGLVLFAFLHFREGFVENFELGQDAKRYVVSQIDFTFPDEEATIILKQEAAYAIGTIYQLNDRQIHERATNFQKYITQDEGGVATWKELARKTDFDDIALALSLLTDVLAESRFADSRTVERLGSMENEKLPIPFDFFYPFVPPRVGSQVTLPLGFWNTLVLKTELVNDLPEPIIHFIVHHFRDQKWAFEVDQGMEYTLRKFAQNQVPEKYTKVLAGSRLIDQGEKVTSRHITMLQAMKERLRVKRNLWSPLTISGTVLMVFMIVFVSALYLYGSHRDTFFSNRKLSLLLTIFVIALVVAKVVEFFLVRENSQIFSPTRFPLFVPFAAILVCSLLTPRLSAFTVVFLSVVLCMGLAVETIPFLIMNLLTAGVTVYYVRAIRRRKEVFVVCARAWIAAILIAVAFSLYENTILNMVVIGDIVSTFFYLLFTAIVVVGLLPILEAVFQIMTDISMMEFMDPSNELLRRLTIEAPGTYQHSVVVGNLAEAAAAAIGANGLFCRVATQYHDIGKLANPQYFTENQLGGMDMHQLLTPLESAQVIIAHVSEGVALARKMGLPEQFIDVIKEHHGDSLVYYFYHKQIESVGKEHVDKKDFRYAGPKPRTKESTIIMIADTLEAASRCLDEYNERTVRELVERLIAQKMEDGQFSDSLLTFEELAVVKETIAKTLVAASHPRIKYPTHHPGEEG